MPSRPVGPEATIERVAVEAQHALAGDDVVRWLRTNQLRNGVR